MTPLRPILALLPLVLAFAAAAPAVAHPQDGPHADVRLRLDDDVLRWNIGLNLAYMDEIVDVGRERIDDVAPIEEEILREAILEHLLEDNRVVIDGEEVEGEVVLWEFRRGDRTLLPLFPRAGMRGVMRAEIIIDYPHSGDPQRIEMTWADFPLDVLSAQLEGGEPAPLVLQAQIQAEGVIELIEFSEGSPTVTWTATGQTVEDRLLPVPELAEAIARLGTSAPGAAGPDDAGAAAPVAAPAAGNASPAAPPRTPRPVTLPLGAIVLAGIGLVAGLAALMPRRPVVARATGGTLAAVLLAAAGWWLVDGPSVRAVAPRLPGLEIARTTAAGPAGRLAVTPAACVAVFQPLLMNVYTAFDYSEESDVYDALARSVDGELLDDLYRRIHRGLVMDDHNRAIARVTAVELLETEVPDPEAAVEAERFEVTARWRVDGTVVHWGHAHIRIHEYAARYAIARTTRGWRIVDQVMLEQVRIPNPADPIEQGVDPFMPRELQWSDLEI